MQKGYLFVLALILIISCEKTQTGNKVVAEDETSEEITTEKSELLSSAQSVFKPISSVEVEDIPQKKVELGKMLYYDKRLSKNETISCNSCHNLDTYGVDNLPFSPGDTKELGGRNSPTVIYASMHDMQFWDGRAKDVEEQAEGPILNPVEHGIPSAEFLEEKLRKVPEYQALFAEVYPDAEEPITFKNVANAIGAFERKLTPTTRFDLYLEGDESQLSEKEKAGLKTFMESGCITCHSGVTLGGKMYQKFGLYEDYWIHTMSENQDEGRFGVTEDENDKFVFKVPGLRNIEKTHPYFHDGSVKSLEDAVKIMSKLQVNKDLNQEEVDHIVTFLKTLTADVDDKYKQVSQ